jgi:glycerol uptake facilitator protein
MVGAFAAGAFGSSDAHLNPAVTIWDAIVTSNPSKLSTYLPAQFLGGFVGAALVWLQYLPHWKETSDPAAKLACFSTGPAIRSAGANLVAEAIGTAVLVIGIGAIFSKAVAGQGLAVGLGPFLVGGLVWGIGLSLGGPTGYAINPARDLAPRIMHAILPIPGKGSSDWEYAWIPVIGPIIGAVIGAVLFRAIA